MRISAGNSPFPPQYRCTHRYTSLKTLTASPATTGHLIFSANGLFDPDISGIGTQPLYFDQLSAIYDHYSVCNSRIRVSVSKGDTNVEPQICTIHVDDDANVGTIDAMLFAQRPGAVARMYSAEGDAMVLGKKWSAGTEFGTNVMSNPNLSGDIAANPSEQSYFIIGVHNTSVLVNQNVDVLIQIEYDVIWHEIKTIPSS